MSVSIRLPFASARGRKSSAVRSASRLRSNTGNDDGSNDSLLRAMSMRSRMSVFKRAICAFVLRVHCVSPESRSVRSLLAEMMASGVFSSCEASVTNRCWRWRLRANGRAILFDSGISRKNTMIAHDSDTAMHTCVTTTRVCRRR